MKYGLLIHTSGCRSLTKVSFAARFAKSFSIGGSTLASRQEVTEGSQSRTCDAASVIFCAKKVGGYGKE